MTDDEMAQFMADAPDVRTTIRRAIQFMDVLLARAAPGSSYIPMGRGRA
ncbi:hypothetical protein [Arthrobacter sp. UYEF36]